jgi:hypothetical protein
MEFTRFESHTLRAFGLPRALPDNDDAGGDGPAAHAPVTGPPRDTSP